MEMRDRGEQREENCKYSEQTLKNYSGAGLHHPRVRKVQDIYLQKSRVC